MELDVQDNMHLGSSQTLRLRQKEERPGASHQHPGREEKPGSVSERCEDVRQRFGNGELDRPLDEGRERAREVAESAGEDLGRDDPRDSVETKGPAFTVVHPPIHLLAISHDKLHPSRYLYGD